MQREGGVAIEWGGGRGGDRVSEEWPMSHGLQGQRRIGDRTLDDANAQRGRVMSRANHRWEKGDRVKWRTQDIGDWGRHGHRQLSSGVS